MDDDEPSALAVGDGSSVNSRVETRSGGPSVRRWRERVSDSRPAVVAGSSLGVALLLAILAIGVGFAGGATAGEDVSTLSDNTTVTVVVDDTDGNDLGQQTADLIERGVDLEENPLALTVVNSTDVDEGLIEETDAFVFHDFAAGDAEDVIPAVEDDEDTHAVYLEQFEDANGISERADVLEDPDVTAVEFDFGEALPVSFDIQANHSLFEGVGESGETVLVHQEEDSDRAFFQGADGETLAEVGIDGEDSDGPVATVDPESEAVLLGTIAPHEFQGEPDFTDDAATILGNAVLFGVDDEPPEVELSELDIAGQGDQALLLEGSEAVSVDVTHVGGGAGEVAVNLTIGETERTETVDIEVDETLTVTVENATSDLSPNHYEVAVSAGEAELTGDLLVSVDANGNGDPATDTTGDGLLNDVNGAGEFTIFDVQSLFNNFDVPAVQNNSHLFDFNEDDQVAIFDVQALFNMLAAQQ